MNPLQGTGTPTRDMTPAQAPADNRTWNSGNHEGDGQNVGFGDGHAEFCRRPDVGQDNDNIYTMSASPSKGPAQFGGIPAGKTAPLLTADKAPYDIIMLPVRNETTGAM
jgi:prepilin-type processing-associated H-X9-DG protein